MDALTIESIICLEECLELGRIYDITTIVYIQTLLTPYAEVVESAHSVEAIAEWIQTALPKELIKVAIRRLALEKRLIDIEIGESLGIAPMTNPEKAFRVFREVKNSVIETILREIFETVKCIYEPPNNFILPWEVKSSIIKFNKGLARKLGLS